MQTAAYLRYSTEHQRAASIADQQRKIEQYCAAHGLPAPLIYQDAGISGTRADRPGYQLMLDDAKARRFAILLVDDMPRLARDAAESLQTLAQLKYYGIRLIGVSDGTDTARAGHELDTGLKSLIAQYNLVTIAANTHRGQTGQVLKGFSAGGKAYGYDTYQDGDGFKRRINPVQAAVVREIFELFAAGYSPRAIANTLNQRGIKSPRGGTWTHSAIYPDADGNGILSNRLYKGEVIWNKTEWTRNPTTGKRTKKMRPKSEWIITSAQELAIIDDALWQQCQARAKSAREQSAHQKQQGKGTGGSGPKYLFSGLLKCGECGGAYVIQGPDYYGCANHKDRGDAVCANRRKVKRSTVEKILLADIRAELMRPEYFNEFKKAVQTELKNQQPDLAQLRKNLVEAQKRQENFVNAIAQGIITPSTRAALLKTEADIETLTNAIEAAKTQQPTQILGRAKEIYQQLVQTLETLGDIPKARECLRLILGDIRLLPDKEGLTAEIQSPGLTGALYQISVVAGTRSVRYSVSKRLIKLY